MMMSQEHDQSLPDDMDDNTYGFGGGTPGGDMDNQQNGGMYHQKQEQQQSGNGGGVNLSENNELNVEQKLQLAERANEIYRQQLKYMQDHLASLRSLIQDKENIIENLMLRYDLGIITQDSNRQNGNLSADEIEMEELRRKAEALAQRTILENFELREMVNELRDENFHLRNEIYELQDKINRQVLQINKLEKNATQNMEQSIGNDIGTDMMEMRNDEYADVDDENDMYQDVDEENDVMEEIEDAPQPNNDDDDDNNNNDRLNKRRPSTQMEDPQYTAEAIAKREARANTGRRASMQDPDLFGDNNSEEDNYMTEEAYAKRKERAEKAHRRDPSVPIPQMFGDQQGSSEEEEEEEEIDQKMQQGTKRRDSKVFMDEEALKKREERSKKHHRKVSSTIPPLFNEDYDADAAEKYVKAKAQRFTPAATEKRLKRQAKKLANSAVKHVKKHRRKESLAEKLLLGGKFDDDDLDLQHADPEQRKKLMSKARAEQRRKSQQMLQQQVGLKEHFSDDDIGDVEDKPQRAGFKTRQKAAARKEKNQMIPEFDPNQAPPPPTDSNMAGHKKRASRSGLPPIVPAEEEKDKKHRRDSSAPVVPLGFEDPDVLLHFEKLKVKDLEAELEKKLNDLDNIKRERDDYQKIVDSAKQTSEVATELKEQVTRDLDEAIQSKADLASKCAMEIMRLTMILNTLLQIPKFQETVQILINESHKQNSKNGSLLG